MLEPIYTSTFKKEYKLMRKRGWDTGKLEIIAKMIVNEEPLPARCRPHPLYGEWEGSTDCHIQGDWVLIYKTNLKARTVTFQRTGSHSDLGL